MEESNIKSENLSHSEGEQILHTAHEVTPVLAEPTSCSASSILLSPSNSAISDASEIAQVGARTAGQSAPCLPEKAKGTRKRLSASARKAKLEAIANDYRTGHPAAAIMLRQGLSKSQFTEMLAKLLLEGALTPIVPAYEVLPASKAIKNIPGLEVIEGGYVRVKITDAGILLTPYTEDAQDEL